MLVIRLYRGESLRAESARSELLWELAYGGTDSAGNPILDLQMAGQAFVSLDVSYGEKFRIRETLVDPRKVRAHRVNLGLDAPQSIRFIRVPCAAEATHG